MLHLLGFPMALDILATLGLAAWFLVLHQRHNQARARRAAVLRRRP